ncbi:MAG: glycosyltransferase [Candidatus Sericytochromatia bacterium]
MSKKKDYSYLLDIIKQAQHTKDVKEEDKLRIKFEGDFSDDSICSKINVNLSSLIIKDNAYITSVSSNQSISTLGFKNKIVNDNIGKTLDKIDFFISHLEKLSLVLPPKNAKKIVFQNWDFGSLPIDWKLYLTNYVDQVWVSSNYNKDCMVNSGLPEQKIKVVNSAIDPVFYNHNVEAESLKVDKRVKFLFKGNLDWKSGIETLLKAYTEEFSASDDVALIISTNKEKLVGKISEYLKEIIKNPESPYIHVIDLPFDEKTSAKLYKSSSFYLSLDKANSYCLDILESMGCAVPVIATGKGSVLDYCTKEDTILLDSTLVYNTQKEIDGIKTETYPSWFETDAEDLKLKLRYAYELNSEKYEKLAVNASKKVLNNFTWSKQKELIDTYLQEIKNNEPQGELQVKINQGIIKALNELKDKNYDKSLEILKEVLEKAPENPDVNFYVANLYFNKKAYSESLDYLTKSLIKNPYHEDYNNLTGVVLFKLKEYTLSKKFFDFTLKIMPNHEGAIQSLNVLKDLDTTESNLRQEQMTVLNQVISYLKKAFLPSVSVCILAKNEEKHLERALRSAKKVANEIIVLDTGSTDRTIEIAEKLADKVIKTEWKNDFAFARNQVMEYASSDWIIMLDADEAFSERTFDKIKPTLMTLDDNKTGTLKIVNFLDKNGILEKFEHYVTRIIPNNKKYKYIRAIHEIPVDNNNNIPETEVLKEIEVLHYGYSSETVLEKNKIERNRKIILDSIEKEPDSFLNYFYLAENYKDEQNYQEIIKYSEKALEIIETNEAVEYKNTIELCKINILEALINNFNLDNKLNTEEAVKSIKDKFELFEDSLKLRPDYWFIRGNYELNLKNYDQSIVFYNECLNLRTQNITSSIDIGTITWKSLFNLALAYNKKEDKEKTLTYINRTIKNSGNNTLVLYQKLLFLLEYQELDKIYDLFLQIEKNISTNILLETLEKIKTVYTENNLLNKFYSFLEEVRKNCKKENNELINKLIEYYDLLLANFPENQPIIYSLAYCYNLIGNTEKSKTLFESILENNKFEVDSLHNIGSIYLNESNLEKAEEIYQQALKVDPFHFETYISLVKLEILKKDLEKAQSYLDKLMEIDPDNNMISLLSFEISNQKNDKKLASDMYSSLIFSKPNF